MWNADTEHPGGVSPSPRSGARAFVLHAVADRDHHAVVSGRSTTGSRRSARSRSASEYDVQASSAPSARGTMSKWHVAEPEGIVVAKATSSAPEPKKARPASIIPSTR